MHNILVTGSNGQLGNELRLVVEERDKENNYLGVVEVTQDITKMRELEGDQRLLSYATK